MRQFSAIAALGALIATSAVACETYDAPPETSLTVPDNGKWYADTPVTLMFTEPVDPASVMLTLWPRELTDDGDLKDGVQPLAQNCTIENSPCAGIQIVLNEAGDTAVINHGDALIDVHGRQIIAEVHAGLRDKMGRERKVKDWFDFAITPDCEIPDPAVPGSALEFELNSGVWALFADLTATLSGIYLQMFVDVSVDRTNGDIWMAGTVATNTGDPGTSDPTALEVYNDDKGWTVFMSGKMGRKADGSFCISTDATDLKVKVLGLIDVELQTFKLDFGLKPKSSPDGRDVLEGFMTSSKVLMNGSDLGDAAAPVVAQGNLAAEIPVSIPRLCQEDPCATMKTEGGDCQLVDPWLPGPNNACE